MGSGRRNSLVPRPLPPPPSAIPRSCFSAQNQLNYVYICMYTFPRVITLLARSGPAATDQSSESAKAGYLHFCDANQDVGVASFFRSLSLCVSRHEERARNAVLISLIVSRGIYIRRGDVLSGGREEGREGEKRTRCRLNNRADFVVVNWTDSCSVNGSKKRSAQ